jgi:hypothetical protein
LPRFRDLDKDLQFKIRQMEHIANEEGKETEECKKLRKELGANKECCLALSKRDGVYVACLVAPTENSLNIHKTPRCKMHGGSAPAHEDIPEESKLKKLQSLRPNANFIHGLYAEKGNFIESLTEGEVEYMVYLEKSIREEYDVSGALEELHLEGMLHKAVLHFRLLNTGRFDRASKHTADPLADILKTCKELGWSRKEQSHEKRQQSVVDKWLNKLDSGEFDFSNEDDSHSFDNEGEDSDTIIN